MAKRIRGPHSPKVEFFTRIDSPGETFASIEDVTGNIILSATDLGTISRMLEEWSKENEW